MAQKASRDQQAAPRVPLISEGNIAMQVRCPQCTQTFSTVLEGRQACPSCGAMIDVPREVGGPAPVAAEPPLPAGDRGPTPWERRRELGFFPALWANWKAVIFHPETFFQRAMPGAPWVDALTFAWLLTAASTLFTVLLTGLGYDPMQNAGELPEQLRQYPQLVQAFEAGASRRGGVVGPIISAVLFPVSFLIAGGLLHVLCILFGAAKHGFGATLRALGYGSAPSLLFWVPVVQVLAMLYAVGLVMWGVYRLQETTQGKVIAMSAAVVALSCCCCCAIGISAAMAFGRS
jgi:hypothetical protein